jgi:hypothetical protein
LAVEGVKVHGYEEPLPCFNSKLLEWVRRRRVAPFSLDLDRRVRGPAEKYAPRLPKTFLFHLHSRAVREMAAFVDRRPRFAQTSSFFSIIPASANFLRSADV